MKKYDVIVCGGGAAGFFSAINIAIKNEGCKVLILEKSSKLLSKVKISGGGRCNVTNGRKIPSELVKFYPRGEKKLYSLMSKFGTKEMQEWLTAYGVPLKTESDLRVFPKSDDSQTIIDCFMKLCHQYNIQIKINSEVTGIKQPGEVWQLITKENSYQSRFVVFATGASKKSWSLLTKQSIGISSPVPSLFTFNIKDPRIQNLQGIAFSNAQVKIESSKFIAEGPLLITHWGLSGPAVLKISAWAARFLHDQNYRFNILVNFNPFYNFDSFRNWLMEEKEKHKHKKLVNILPNGIVTRYWHNLISYCQISPERLMKDLSKKNINKLSEECTQAIFSVNGKSTFKEEFVTCGGIELNEVNLKSMESKHHKGLFYCGEVLNIDGITGGFNFQACWATGWTVSESITQSLKGQ